MKNYRVPNYKVLALCLNVIIKCEMLRDVNKFPKVKILTPAFYCINIIFMIKVKV